MKTEDMLKEYPNMLTNVQQMNGWLDTAIKAGLKMDGSLQAVVQSDFKSATNEISDTTAQNVAELVDDIENISLALCNYAREIRQKVDETISLKSALDKAVNNLSIEEKRIIELRYFEYPEPKYNWNKVVQESYYCERQCYKLKDSAMKKIEEYLKECSKMQ